MPMNPAVSEQAKNTMLASIATGAILGIISAAGSPSGWLWTAIRVINGVVFVLALLVWLAARWRSRRAAI